MANDPRIQSARYTPEELVEVYRGLFAPAAVLVELTDENVRKLVSNAEKILDRKHG